jgi:hypothetical protein
MDWRSSVRWLGALLVLFGLVAVASCGGASSDLSAAPDGSVVFDGPTFGNADGGGICPSRSCADLGYKCGWNGDGCNDTLQCGTCSSPDYCGGGGFSQCGDAPAPADAGNGCTPKTCAGLGYTCGVNGDGCGGTINCGAGCPSPTFCGGGGFSQCGGGAASPDGGPRCIPTTCAALGYTCGFAGDGCGGVLDCRAAGGCPSPTYCGGGGFNVCGGNAGPPACTPQTCAEQGFNCGPAGDGCGHALDCGASCPAGQACGAAGQPGVCGAGPTCTGLCAQRATCTAGATTTITGTVRAAISSWVPPNTQPDPVPGVLVYIPNAPLQPFAPGVHCGTCSADVSGDPLVSTTTSFDGTFRLSNVPVSKNGSDAIPIVIQLGRWRRQFSFVISSPCAPNQVGTLSMPSVESATSDIPLTAISTGAVDTLECILLKMGVDQSQFTTNVAQAPGRIHLYSAGPGTADKDGHGPGAYIAAPKHQAQPDESTLLGSGAAGSSSGGTYMNYDQIMLPCWGAEYFKAAGPLANLVSYAQSGGHFFATHFSYTWLYQNDLFASTALWDVNSDTNPNYTPFTGNVSRSVPPPVATPPGLFVEWLNYVGALDGANPAAAPPDPATVTIQAARHDVDGVLGSSVDWIDGTDPDQSGASARTLLHFTFDVNSCGHAIFSDFHVVNQVNTNGVVFPQECDKTALTAQGRVLEYMIWNLASCVGGTPPAGCTPRTCAEQQLTCGPAGDGCGGALDCGACAAPQTCGGGGVAARCGGGGACVPSTCAEEKIACGAAGDGCGNLLQCGSCVAPQTCGGGGVPGQCGGGSLCQPETCAKQNVTCGPSGDGCGGVVDCGKCVAPMTCGGGGVPGQCGGSGACTPQTCADQGIACGPTGDGCGNLVQCGPCVAPQTCGGAGVPGQCGGGEYSR